MSVEVRHFQRLDAGKRTSFSSGCVHFRAVFLVVFQTHHRREDRRETEKYEAEAANLEG